MASRPAHDSVLLLGFGGPTRREEVRPFLDNVLRGRPVPKERYEEVVRHYDEVGGASPFNRLTLAQAESLRGVLAREGPDLPVYVGMRHWEPYVGDTLAVMADAGRRRSVAIVLAAHRSPPSWEAYLVKVEEAQARLGEAAPSVDYAAAWSDHPLFVEALADRTAQALAAVPQASCSGARLVFTAHSIPTAMAERSGYALSLRRTGELLAARLQADAWSMAYTSRSGDPADPWLEPDVSDELRALKARGASDVVVSPIGFLVDHVEVLYDLDVAARRTAEALGLRLHRARTAGDHPAFARLLAALVREVVSRG